MLHYTTPDHFHRKQLFSDFWNATLLVSSTFNITNYNTKNDTIGVLENGEAYVMQLNMPTLKDSYESRITLEESIPKNSSVHTTNDISTIFIPSTTFLRTITYNISNEDKKQ